MNLDQPGFNTGTCRAVFDFILTHMWSFSGAEQAKLCNACKLPTWRRQIQPNKLHTRKPRIAFSQCNTIPAARFDPDLARVKISSCVIWKTRSLSPQWKGDKCDQHQRSDDKLKKERSPDHRPIISCVFSESRSLETPRYWEIFHRGYFLVKLPGRSMYRSGIYSTCSTSYCGAEYFWRFFPSAD